MKKTFSLLFISFLFLQVFGGYNVEGGISNDVPTSSCTFTTGDGTGGSEINVGVKRNAAECFKTCMERKKTVSNINGVTISSGSAVNVKCYCEKGMTGNNVNKKYKTCKLQRTVCTDDHKSCIYLKGWCEFNFVKSTCKKFCGTCIGTTPTTTTTTSTTTTTTTTTTRSRNCRSDVFSTNYCLRQKRNTNCEHPQIKKYCGETCGYC